MRWRATRRCSRVRTTSRKPGASWIRSSRLRHPSTPTNQGRGARPKRSVSPLPVAGTIRSSHRRSRRRRVAMNPLVALFDTLTAYQRTAALRAAVELDLFTAIAEGAVTVEALAARTGAAPRGVRGLCDALAAVGFLTKSGDRYALTPELAPMLDGRSPAYIAGAVRFIGNPAIWQAFGDLTAAVRRGGTTWEGEGSVDPDNPLWVQFARAMAPTAAFTAAALADAL